MVRISNFLFILYLLSSLPVLQAQISTKGTPSSIALRLEEPLSVVLQMPPLKEIYAEDRENAGSNRFAVPIPTEINYVNNGSWSFTEKSAIWRISIQVPGAKGLILTYDQFQLPPKSRLFVYQPEGTKILGAYTHLNNREHQKFLTGIVSGEEAIVEFECPLGYRDFEMPFFRINRVFAVYPPEKGRSDNSDFNTYQGNGYGDALPCHVNINCPEGDDWQDEKRGVVRIMRVFEEGTGWCTGSLINNTLENGYPFLLTAFHCMETPPYTPDYDLWRFDFNYEYNGCVDGITEPGFNSVIGCQILAGRAESDFALLHIPYGIPHSYNPYFNGWDKSTFVPASGTIIHHPYGDVKKFAKDIQQLTIHPNAINWNNGVTTPPNYHLKAILDIGTIEGGSSGAPLFNSSGHIVGQLHGGNANCTNFLTFNGRLEKSWDEGDTITNRLKEWLDPAQTGTQVLNAYQPVDTLPFLKGFVRDPKGQPIQNVLVIRGGVDSIITDSTGGFIFYQVPLDSTGWVQVEKNSNPQNGITTFDLVIMQKHILGIETFSNPYQFAAADVNLSGTVTTFDQLQILKVILGIDTQFPVAPSWQFFPKRFNVKDIPVHATSVLITGVKTGDTNFSANPAE